MMWPGYIISYVLIAVSLHKITDIFSNFKFMANSVFRFIMVGAVVFLIMIIHLLIHFGPSEIMFSIIVWYMFLCELYIFLFTLSLGCVSINLLKLLHQGDKAMSEMNQLYQPSAMLFQRFARLRAVGLIEYLDEAPVLTKKGTYLIKIVLITRALFHQQGGV